MTSKSAQCYSLSASPPFWSHQIKKKSKKTYQQQRPSHNWKTDNFPNQMWLWPKSGGEETVIHPGMLINYHTDCLLIFLCSLWYLMKYTHFMQTSHRTADAGRSKADANVQVGQVSTSAEGKGQGQILPPTALNLSIQRLISSPAHKG